MIRGIGIDVIEVERITQAMQREGFLERILTEKERADTISPLTLAGKWAAKEAVAKAVGTHLNWHDVEITGGAGSKPEARILRREHVGVVHVSISHEKGIAAAVAVWEVGA